MPRLDIESDVVAQQCMHPALSRTGADGGARAASGLFRDLRSFADLERRLEALPERYRGNAFAAFVRGYLGTQEIAQADHVWAADGIPDDVRQRLELAEVRPGCTGVYRGRSGELVVYQARFVPGRAPLPRAQLTALRESAPRADARTLFTNATIEPAVVESQPDLRVTRGGDFDRLDAEELARIAAWIDGVAPAPPSRRPRPHQCAALADIEAALAEQDRATVVMPCGTGKTLVALWAAERSMPRRVLVLVPSLGLLRQTLQEWARWTSWGRRFRYLCVCSDPRVAKASDELPIGPGDVDFPVRTDSAVVGRFLDRGDDSVSVVFCTYHSAPVVGVAMAGREPFDLAIFDEAHKTAGRRSARFAFALRDDNIPIRKRLFFTATPRRYDIATRDRTGDFAVASMDDEAVYGPVAHRLSFARAAAEGIIAPYKVVISAVDGEMLDSTLLDRGETLIKSDRVRAKWVAQQIALERAVEAHGIKRIITFHSSIRAARAFAADDAMGVCNHLPAFRCYHVSGAQPACEREAQMRAFAAAPRGLVTNARCLTEGMDVPSVDLVGFMNPRRSKVDIVQAVGRALRRAQGKTCGYVLVPLFQDLRGGETIDMAYERGGFSDIARVLNALRENDEELSDIIKELTVERGRTGAFDPSPLLDKVEVIGPRIGFAELSASICARLVEALGFTWDERYGRLLAYKEMHGDCDVPQAWQQDPALGIWCDTQRMLYRTGRLAAERVRRLEAIGFTWDPLAALWEQKYARLEAFRRIHGHCDVPRTWTDQELASWCSDQRKRYKHGKVSVSRIRRLEQLGFNWNPFVAAWDRQFARLEAFRRQHGHCDVPEGLAGGQLRAWCYAQRQMKRAGRLSEERVGRLDGLGFDWEPFAVAWEQQFARLVAFRKEHGHCDVARMATEPQLRMWCYTQRRMSRAGRLAAERIRRLEQIGFEWESGAEAPEGQRAKWQDRGISQAPPAGDGGLSGPAAM